MEIWLLEQDVSKKIGVARAVIAEYRKEHLTLGEDWRVERKQVELSQSAVDKISTALGATPALSPITPPPPVPEAVELIVLRLLPNPRLLVAVFPDDLARRHTLYVSVAMNKNFRPGMRIKTRPPDNGTAIYKLEGRCPRYPGRW
jgi:hypothetical protein